MFHAQRGGIYSPCSQPKHMTVESTARADHDSLVILCRDHRSQLFKSPDQLL